MSKEIQNDAGETEIVYTADEYKALEADAGKAKTLETELAEAKRLIAERGENFTAYSKMSEEERKVYDANTTNLLKREENLLTELAGVKTTLAEKEEKEKTSLKTNALSNIHQGDEATKTKVEAEYALLTGMPETTQDEINARAQKAALLAGIQIDPRNPLYIPVNGEAPMHKDKKEFVETPEGTQAMDMVRDAMGIKKV